MKGTQDDTRNFRLDLVDSSLVIRQADSIRLVWSAKVDSIQQLSLSDSLFQHQLDSINTWFRVRHDKVTAQIAQLRGRAQAYQDSLRSKLFFFSLPDDPVALNASLKRSGADGAAFKFNLPEVSVAGKFPELDFRQPDPLRKFQHFQQSQIERFKGYKGVGEVNGLYTGFQNLTTKVDVLREDIGAFAAGRVEEMQSLPVLAESKLTSLATAGGIGEQMGDFGRFTDAVRDPEGVKNLLAEQAMSQATDLLSEKPELVQSSMAAMAKLKRKFKSVGGLHELPKNLKVPRNGLKGEPFKSRFMPGVNFGVRNLKDTLQIHVFPTATYQLTGRVRLGAGAYYRLVELKNEWRFYQRAPWWGAMAFGAFAFAPDLLVRLEMNALNRPSYSDEGWKIRTWSSRYLVGIQRDFNLGRRLQGSGQFLYDFTYRLSAGLPDKLEIRVGLAYSLVNRNPVGRKRVPQFVATGH